jgi:hypothetical protein
VTEPDIEPESSQQERKLCPFCGETILHIAVTCRYCGKLLDPSPHPEDPTPPPAKLTVGDGGSVGIRRFITLPLILLFIVAGLLFPFLVVGYLLFF